MSHEDGNSGGGLPDFVSGLVEAAKGGLGSIRDAVGGVVDHVTPDSVNPFGEGGGGGGAPDAAGLLQPDPELATAAADALLQVVVA